MYEAFDLSGRCAVVTGGNGGIGLGMARALLGAGASVAIWGSNEAKTLAARDALAAGGGRVEAFVCDIGNEAQVERAFDASVPRCRPRCWSGSTGRNGRSSRGSGARSWRRAIGARPLAATKNRLPRRCRRRVRRGNRRSARDSHRALPAPWRR